jgi:hypothetical protein
MKLTVIIPVFNEAKTIEEIVRRVQKTGLRARIFEVPIVFNPREYSEGKKIKMKDAFIAVWTLVKYRFVD